MTVTFTFPRSANYGFGDGFSGAADRRARNGQESQVPQRRRQQPGLRAFERRDGEVLLRAGA
ncbi:hypothetical protein ACFYXQ_46670 [Nocardia jiangxiensis]|uniref:Uncharacterized protein n=1 Tax=Nocardia jiangxiensis TaxID=282685 RepID=A0ABW6SFX8_9NOCA